MCIQKSDADQLVLIEAGDDFDHVHEVIAQRLLHYLYAFWWQHFCKSAFQSLTGLKNSLRVCFGGRVSINQFFTLADGHLLHDTLVKLLWVVGALTWESGL